MGIMVHYLMLWYTVCRANIWYWYAIYIINYSNTLYMSEKEDFYIEIDEDLYRICTEHAKKENFPSVDEFILHTMRLMLLTLEMKRQGYQDLIEYFKKNGLTDLELMVFTKYESGNDLLDIAKSLNLTDEEAEDLLIDAYDKFQKCFQFDIND